MKKTKTLLLVLCSILFLTAAPFAQALTPKPFKAVLFFDIGGIKDSGFSRSAYQGMEKAVARLGVQAVYVENARPLELDRALSQAAAITRAMERRSDSLSGSKTRLVWMLKNRGTMTMAASQPASIS